MIQLSVPLECPSESSVWSLDMQNCLSSCLFVDASPTAVCLSQTLESCFLEPLCIPDVAINRDHLVSLLGSPTLQVVLSCKAHFIMTVDIYLHLYGGLRNPK